MNTKGLLDDIFESWDPKYIIIPQQKRPKDIVTHKDWNELWNLATAQGDWNSEALDKIINQGTIKVKRAEYADDSDKLDGHHADYFAYRHNVIGLDEDKYKPGLPVYRPTNPRHPANKDYVDYVADHIADYTSEFDDVVYFDNVETGPEMPWTMDKALKDGVDEVIHLKYLTKNDYDKLKQELIDELMPQGGGDMVRALYDKDDTGVVDDAEKLGGLAPVHYLRAYTRGLGVRTPIGVLEFLITD